MMAIISSVSEEFSEFLAARVLTSQRLIDEIANGRNKEKYQAAHRQRAPWLGPRFAEVVAAVVGYGTNWVGVKMIFYPIEYLGVCSAVHREGCCLGRGLDLPYPAAAADGAD
eukprot:s375_g1.t1